MKVEFVDDLEGPKWHRNGSKKKNGNDIQEKYSFVFAIFM